MDSQMLWKEPTQSIYILVHKNVGGKSIIEREGKQSKREGKRVKWLDGMNFINKIWVKSWASAPTNEEREEPLNFS